MLPRCMKLIAPGLALVLTLTLFLAACGSSSSPATGVVTVNWWSWNPDKTTVVPFIDGFNKTHPTIKLVFKNYAIDDYINTLKVAMPSGTGPDLLGVQAGGFVNQFSPFLEDLTPLEQKANGAHWADQFYTIGLSQLQRGTKTEALPFTVSAAGYIWYNKTIFDRYKLQPPKTLNDWVAVSKTLKSKGVTPFLQGAKDTWQDEDMFIAFANSIAPGKIYDAIAGKISFTDPDLVKAMDVWKALFSNSIIQNGALGLNAYPDARDQWVSGKAAMIFFGTWNNDAMTRTRMSSYQSQLGFTQNYEYLPALLPQVGNYPTRLFGGPDVGLSINKASKVKDAAWQVIQWLESANGGQRINAQQLNIPALKSVPNDTSGVFTAEQKAALVQEQADLSNAIGYRAIPYTAIDTALGAALQNVASGQQSSQDALQTVQQTSTGVQR